MMHHHVLVCRTLHVRVRPYFLSPPQSHSSTSALKAFPVEGFSPSDSNSSILTPWVGWYSPAELSVASARKFEIQVFPAYIEGHRRLLSATTRTRRTSALLLTSQCPKTNIFALNIVFLKFFVYNFYRCHRSTCARAKGRRMEALQSTLRSAAFRQLCSLHDKVER